MVKKTFFLISFLSLFGCASLNFKSVRYGMTYEEMTDALGEPDAFYTNPNNKHMFVGYMNRNTSRFSWEKADYVVEFNDKGEVYSKIIKPPKLSVVKNTEDESGLKKGTAIGLMLQGMGQAMQSAPLMQPYQSKPDRNTNCSSQVIGNTIYTNCN